MPLWVTHNVAASQAAPALDSGISDCKNIFVTHSQLHAPAWVWCASRLCRCRGANKCSARGEAKVTNCSAVPRGTLLCMH